MALDPNEIIVAPTGQLLLAPEGTAPPTDTTTAWPAAWIDLGYLSEDAVSRSYDSNAVDIGAWQADAPVYSDVTLSQTLQFQLMQWNEDTLTFAFGGGVFTPGLGPFTGSYEAPAKSAYLVHAMGVEVVQGDRIFRFGYPRVKISELGDSNFKGDEAALLDVTVKVLDNAGQPTWSVIGLDSNVGGGTQAARNARHDKAA